MLSRRGDGQTNTLLERSHSALEPRSHPMASFEKLPPGVWRARVRRQGHTVARSFRLKADADTWVCTGMQFCPFFGGIGAQF